MADAKCICAQTIAFPHSFESGATARHMGVACRKESSRGRGRGEGGGGKWVCNWNKWMCFASCPMQQKNLGTIRLHCAQCMHFHKDQQMISMWLALGGNQQETAHAKRMMVHWIELRQQNQHCGQRLCPDPKQSAINRQLARDIAKLTRNDRQ